MTIAPANLAAAFDSDVVAAKSEDQQAEEGIVLDRGFCERLVQRLGAQIANHGDALLRHVGSGLRDWCLIVVATTRIGNGFGALRRLRGLLRLGQPVGDGLNLACASIDKMPHQVGLAGFAVDAFGLLRQLAAAIVVNRQERAALGQVVL